ncbi:MAG: hypothetical protein M1824_004154 [Vezdaea acicularis]|nr:MAG: hypothetical protein M1824_004154 [Vezdaea acicularis]
MAQTANYRLIDIDRLDPEAACNFDTSALLPPLERVSTADVQAIAGQVRQLLRGGDTEGALVGVLGSAPYGGDAPAKDVHLATVIEVLQSIKASEMSPMLKRISSSEGGTELLDVLMKYLYKGMAHPPSSTSSTSSSGRPTSTLSPQPTGFSQIHTRNTAEGGGQAMSVLLSWHEKLVEFAGLGCVIRVMADRRTV